MPHEKAKQELLDSFLASCKYAAQDYHEKLSILEKIPEDVSVNAAYGSIRVETVDPKVMTKVAKALSAKVEKRMNEYAQKGQLKIELENGHSLVSQNIDLPETCTFKKVEKVITVYEPSGDCGPWFKKPTEDTVNR